MRSPGRLSGARQSQGCNLQGRQMHTQTHTETYNNRSGKMRIRKKVGIYTDLTTEKDVIVCL